METKSQEVGALLEALSKAQGVMAGAKQDSKNPFFKSDYADLTSVWAACRKPLSDNGLSIVQTIEAVSEKMFLVTLLGHSSGQWIKSYLPLTIKEIGKAQEVGSAITYARRYALAAMVCVCPAGEDDDGEAAREAEKARPIEKAQPAASEESTLTPFETLKQRVGADMDVTYLYDFVMILAKERKQKASDTVKAALYNQTLYSTFKNSYSDWLNHSQEIEMQA